MSKKKKNPVLAFFASVKLALFLLFVLAATSIIGTVVPQNSPAEEYVQLYGKNMARFMEVTGIVDMYHSPWFLGLLGLFCLNLIVCSLDRIPAVWRLVTMDNLNVKETRLRKMRLRKEFSKEGTVQEVASSVKTWLASKGWKADQREQGDSILLFAQKGAWTRFGVYIVHTSILLIIVGALIGSTFGFKGSVMIPETKQSDVIYSFKTGEKIPLGFTVRCDRFVIEYYKNGMPKEYRSDLTILENNTEVLHKAIEVNDPLTYRGITFYQSSYQPYQDFVIRVKNTKTGAAESRVVSPGKQIVWSQGGASYGIINMEMLGESVRRVKVWFTDNQGDPATFWVETDREAIIKMPSADFSFTAKQLYATGLQVTRDPGVWIVYAGCGTMLLGLIVAFFMSHRRLWVLVERKNNKTAVFFAGSANKNKLGFEKTFTDLTDEFQETGP